MSIHQCPKCDARFRGDIGACPIDGTPLIVPQDPFIGTTIAGRYVVEELLGVGGMGSVYRARHQFIGRHVALKFLDASLTKNERLRKRFLGEARAANQINHEHIIDITDFGETEEGIVYMVMEYLDGVSLEDEIERGPLELRRALRIALQIALGLGRAHELGVVHRDIKPGNVHLTRRRLDSDFVKILDFGVARIEQDARITGANMIVGTPEYIAPEQIRSSGATPASDLYSLGCLLFEMLTGQIPFDGKTTVLLIKHINDPPPLPSTLRADIPPEVDRLVLKLLEKRPDDRHRDAYHLVEELQRLLDTLPGVDSSQRPRGSRPSGTVPSRPAQPGEHAREPEEEDWARTARLYRELLREAHPGGEVPDWLPDAIRGIEELVTEVRGLRKSLAEAAEQATEQEEEVRKPRQQIGRALDELAKDDSKLGRQIMELLGELEPAEARLDAAMHSVLRGAKAAPTHLSAGEVVTEQHAAALRELVRNCSELSLARDTVTGLRTRLARKKAERKDLRYQIGQLKETLGQLNQSSTVDMEIWHEEVHRLTGQIQARLEAIVPVAKRIAGHFNQFPHLRERIGRGHAPVTVNEAADVG
ncbi:MAG: protein kinase [Myxococcales bacterium]|jgi:serine/threonine-protein kinase